MVKRVTGVPEHPPNVTSSRPPKRPAATLDGKPATLDFLHTFGPDRELPGGKLFVLNENGRAMDRFWIKVWDHGMVEVQSDIGNQALRPHTVTINQNEIGFRFMIPWEKRERAIILSKERLAEGEK